MRDWFFFVVWYMRLSKILVSLSEEQNMNDFYFFDPKYKEILFKLIKQNMTVEQIKEHFEQRKESMRILWPLRTDYIVRVENIKVNFFKDHLYDAQHGRMSFPEIELSTSKLAVDFSSL